MSISELASLYFERALPPWTCEQTCTGPADKRASHNASRLPLTICNLPEIPSHHAGMCLSVSPWHIPHQSDKSTNCCSLMKAPGHIIIKETIAHSKRSLLNRNDKLIRRLIHVTRPPSLNRGFCRWGVKSQVYKRARSLHYQLRLPAPCARLVKCATHIIRMYSVNHILYSECVTEMTDSHTWERGSIHELARR